MDENTSGVPNPGNDSGAGQAEIKNGVLGFVAKVEALLDEYMIAKAPLQIPMGGKEFLVQVAPYFIIVILVLTLLPLLALFGLATLFAPAAMVAGGATSWGFFSIVGVAASVAVLIFNAMAVPGLFKRTHASWRLVFYGTLVSFISGALSRYPVGAIVGAIIAWYILFQMKELYKN